jgi:hypothetical protein
LPAGLICRRQNSLSALASEATRPPRLDESNPQRDLRDPEHPALVVITGLDPVMTSTSQRLFAKIDGCSGRPREDALRAFARA